MVPLVAALRAIALCLESLHRVSAVLCFTIGMASDYLTTLKAKLPYAVCPLSSP